MTTAVPTHVAATRLETAGLRVDLGGTVAELRTGDAAWLGKLRTRFEGFVTDAPPNLVLNHRADRPGPPVAISGGGHLVELNGAPSTGLLDGVLRTVLPGLAAPALVVHGGLLAGGGSGFLFCGRSGAGKSTLAALLPDHALCDELALVRAAGGGFDGVSLPFWEARPGRAPLAGIFLLEHAPVHRRDRLTPAAAARALRRHVYWPADDAAALAGTFATMTDLAAAVPAWRLGFARDAGVWRTIAEAA